MRKLKLALVCLVVGLFLAFGTVANAVVVDFTGGTAYLSGGGTGITNNSNLYSDAYRYEENGFRFDFYFNDSNITGVVGDYYSIGSGGFVGNDVIHAHWYPTGGNVTSMVISKIGGGTFDLNYIDITSNTTYGGGQQTGTELSYITNDSSYSMLLPSSDWGFAFDFYGGPGDGVARLWLDNNFDGVSSVTFTSTNAYCFGLDNFYIDEEAPPSNVPLPAAVWLLGSGLVGLVGFGRKLLG